MDAKLYPYKVQPEILKGSNHRPHHGKDDRGQVLQLPAIPYVQMIDTDGNMCNVQVSTNRRPKGHPAYNHKYADYIVNERLALGWKIAETMTEEERIALMTERRAALTKGESGKYENGMPLLNKATMKAAMEGDAAALTKVLQAVDKPARKQRAKKAKPATEPTEG